MLTSNDIFILEHLLCGCCEALPEHLHFRAHYYLKANQISACGGLFQ